MTNKNIEETERDWGTFKLVLEDHRIDLPSCIDRIVMKALSNYDHKSLSHREKSLLDKLVATLPSIVHTQGATSLSTIKGKKFFSLKVTFHDLTVKVKVKHSLKTEKFVNTALAKIAKKCIKQRLSNLKQSKTEEN